MNPDDKNITNPHGAASVKQLECLAKSGIPVPPDLTRYQAFRLISNHVAQQRQLPPTQRQETLLRHRGFWNPSFTRGEA